MELLQELVAMLITGIWTAIDFTEKHPDVVYGVAILVAVLAVMAMPFNKNRK